MLLQVKLVSIFDIIFKTNFVIENDNFFCEILLESEHKVKTKAIQIDFSGGHEIYEPVAKELEKFEIGVLGLYMFFSSSSVFFVCLSCIS